MNIIVRTFNGNTIARPDTTYTREDGASYLPGFVSEVTLSPVLFARICRAGRSIQEKFVERYVSSLGAGVLLYPENLIGNGPEGYASACCLDHTTFLSSREFSPAGLEGASLEILKDGATLYEGMVPSSRDIMGAVCEASRSCYLRTGDIVALEIARRKELIRRPCENCSTEIRLGGEFLYFFEVIL